MKTNKRTNKYKYLQWKIFERDSYTCVLCSRPATDVHHHIKRSQGGTDEPHNLVSLCRVHHDLMHGTRWVGVDMTRDEAWHTLTAYLCDCYADEMQNGLYLEF